MRSESPSEGAKYLEVAIAGHVERRRGGRDHDSMNSEFDILAGDCEIQVPSSSQGFDVRTAIVWNHVDRRLWKGNLPKIQESSVRYFS